MSHSSRQRILTAERRERAAEPVAAHVSTGGTEFAALIQQQPRNDQMTTAIVESISPEGIAKVVIAGDTQSCDASSVLQFASAAAASDALLGRTVLVLLNRHTQPIILGVVALRLWEPSGADTQRELRATLPTEHPRSVVLDQRCLDLEAAEEIRLTCGKSSLVLRRDGTVIVRGVNIVSRATQSNKIRGGTVSVN